jgi:hypothetical protein
MTSSALSRRPDGRARSMVKRTMKITMNPKGPQERHDVFIMIFIMIFIVAKIPR